MSVYQWKSTDFQSFESFVLRITVLDHGLIFLLVLLACTYNNDTIITLLKTSKEKCSALLQRFVQQSNQNNLDARKAVWKGLDRTLTEAGSNLTTELKFTEALSGLSKDTAPGPDRVKYPDIKNLSVDNKSELYRLYEDSLATGLANKKRTTQSKKTDLGNRSQIRI